MLAYSSVLLNARSIKAMKKKIVASRDQGSSRCTQILHRARTTVWLVFVLVVAHNFLQPDFLVSFSLNSTHTPIRA